MLTIYNRTKPNGYLVDHATPIPNRLCLSKSSSNLVGDTVHVPNASSICHAVQPTNANAIHPSKSLHVPTPTHLANSATSQPCAKKILAVFDVLSFVIA